LNDISEIENIIVTKINGVPILVRNVAEVREAGKPRLGQVSRDKNEDVIRGHYCDAKGENPARC
jgi:cobalt-zinc-cadmium resistance protein CzcA